jgi:beta-phosphoglucomutase-like phosphatase (HAD superfamily)
VSIEVLRTDLPRGRFRAVLFDFDGTLSLIRRNWQNVMIPMMADELAATGTSESREELLAHIEEFVMRLNGRQTIYQMIELADEVRARGGQPLEPIAYKHRYHNLLWAQIEDRIAGLRDGRHQPDDWTVPHSRQLLEALRSRGLALYLASGTDLKYVRDELAVLRLDYYFHPHVYGALDNYEDFSKAKIVRQILRDTSVSGEQLLGFGDGFVEIEEIRRAGGVAIGVASDEETRHGVNAWKRQRLIRAGADVIIGDYRCLVELLELLGI